jgi:hypothetical protein
MNRLVMLLTLTLLLTPLSGCTEEEAEDVLAFPSFSQVADNGETYNNARMAGGGFIVVFSAEWCNSPCYTTMHAIWAAQAELPVFVMSTDPAENATGITLSEWHDSANAHDDEGEDIGVTLTTYAFMKGSEVAKNLDITRPGSLGFVNGDGEVVYLHEGRMDNTDDILKYWNLANA